MSTFAAARVETKIVLQGEGNAAKAVADVRRGLDGLDAAGAKAAKGTAAAGASVEAFAKAGTQTAQRGGAAFAGLAAVLGGSVVPELAKAGQSLKAAGAAANILPGPIGLAAAGVAALAIGAFELNKHFSEVAAKVANLGTAGTRDLAERLHLSVDEAIKLEQALGELPGTLKPTESLLQVVRQRAEAIGKEGGDAVAKFAEALAKGPEALKAFEAEFGRLSSVSAKLPDVTSRLGLSREALGIATGVANEAERAKAAAERAVVLDRERQGLLAGAEQLAAKAAQSTVVRGLELGKQATSLREQAATQAVLVARAVEEANALQEVVEKQRAVANAAAARQASAAAHAATLGLAEAQAATILDSQARLRAQGNVLSARSAEIGRRIVELQDAKRAGLLDEVGFQRELLGLQTDEARNKAARQALVRQAQSDRKAAFDRERAQQDAELAAEIKLAKIRADAAEAAVLPVKVIALRRRELALEEVAEVQKAERAVNTARGRALAIDAIEREFAQKRVALDLAVAANEQKLADDNRAALVAGNQRSAEIAAKTADVVSAGAQRRAQSLADALRASGQDERADLVERRQAWVDYQAQVAKSAAELKPLLESTAAGSEDRANVEKQALEASAQAWEAYQARVDASTRASSARLRENIATAVEAIRAPAELLASSGGPGAKLGKALQATAAGIQSVSRGWKEAGNNSAAVVGAVGQVAAAFVDGEREKAAILAITEAAAAVASYPNVPAMVAHGAAAVLYGAAAGGFIGGASGGAPSVPSAGDLADRASPVDGGGTGAGGGNVVNVYFGRGFVVGTPQQVGAAVNGAVGSLKGSGLKVGKGV